MTEPLAVTNDAAADDARRLEALADSEYRLAARVEELEAELAAERRRVEAGTRRAAEHERAALEAWYREADVADACDALRAKLAEATAELVSARAVRAELHVVTEQAERLQAALGLRDAELVRVRGRLDEEPGPAPEPAVDVAVFEAERDRALAVAAAADVERARIEGELDDARRDLGAVRDELAARSREVEELSARAAAAAAADEVSAAATELADARRRIGALEAGRTRSRAAASRRAAIAKQVETLTAELADARAAAAALEVELAEARAVGPAGERPTAARTTEDDEEREAARRLLAAVEAERDDARRELAEEAERRQTADARAAAAAGELGAARAALSTAEAALLAARADADAAEAALAGARAEPEEPAPPAVIGAATGADDEHREQALRDRAAELDVREARLERLALDVRERAAEVSAREFAVERAERSRVG